MLQTSFKGCDILIDRLDQAVQAGTVNEITRQVQSILSDMLHDGTVLELPSDFKAPRQDKYARRLLHRSSEHGYTVVVMIWGPEQGTLLHDHDGTWCVEGVLEGEIRVTQYDLLERQADQWHFSPQHTIKATPGEAGSLIPPFEYHTIANTLSERSSVTVHVYGRELTSCTVFDPQGDEWYRSRQCQLTYDN
jgi:3-mercaptopropionate dioxygenase